MADCPTLEELTPEMKDANLLGEGAYGKVYKIGDFVLKATKLGDERRNQLFAREKQIIEFLVTRESFKPFIPKLCWVKQTPEKGYILQRYEPVIPLNVFLKQMKDEGRKWEIGVGGVFLTKVLKAVDLLHKNNILHRDIKPENILVRTANKDAQKNPMLIDFGLSCTVHDCNDLEVGSVGYFAANFFPKSMRSTLERTFPVANSEGTVRSVRTKSSIRTVLPFSSKLTDKYALALTVQQIMDRIHWPDTPQVKALKNELEETHIKKVKHNYIGELAVRRATAMTAKAAKQEAQQRKLFPIVAAQAAELARLKKFEAMLKKYMSQKPESTRRVKSLRSKSQPTRKRLASL